MDNDHSHSHHEITFRELLGGIGLVGAFFLTLSFSGFLLIVLNLLGIHQRSGGLIPDIGDPRAVVVSSLGLLILGLAPLTLRLLFPGPANKSPPKQQS